MGLKKAYKRRKRRGSSSRHRLVGGRTGSVRHKQRKGLLHELKRRKRRAIAVKEATQSSGDDRRERVAP